jgi:histidinol-phosphate aminotransferase
MTGSSGYAPPAFVGAIRLDLSKNEGRAPCGLDLIRSVTGLSELARYPDLKELQSALAATYGVSAERVLVTAGADDALLRLCLLQLRRTNGEAKKHALVAAPTFEMIPRYVGVAGGDLVTVPWPSGAFPTDALLAAASEHTSLVVVVSPNNPTGAVATYADVARIARELPGACVVLDAAYAEYGGEDLVSEVQGMPNVVVVRTLSKAWGLAGLRVGCAIAPADVLQQLHAAGNPMPVSIASARLAVRWLQDGRDYVAAHVAWVCQKRVELARRLRCLGVAPSEPCQGNFLLVRGVRPEWLTRALAAFGIAVRRFPGQADLRDAVRIGVPSEQGGYDELVAALEVVLAPQALLFDMDGVLADVTASYRQAIVQTAASFGVVVTPADVTAAKARGDANDDWQLTRSLMAARGVSRDLAEVVAQFERRYEQLRDGERLLVAAEQLRGWRRRMPLAVVTGRPREQAEYFLAQFEIRELFDAVVCREDAALKPDPAPVKLAMERLGVRSAWMLGDTIDDLDAARGAGALPIGVGSQLVDQRAACILTSAADLEGLL